MKRKYVVIGGACFLDSHVVDDLLSNGGLKRLFRACRPDVMIHLAARAGVRSSLLDAIQTRRTNVDGTVAVLDAARKGVCKPGAGRGTGRRPARAPQVPAERAGEA